MHFRKMSVLFEDMQFGNSTATIFVNSCAHNQHLQRILIFFLVFVMQPVICSILQYENVVDKWLKHYINISRKDLKSNPNK